MLFGYDFTDLSSAADVVASLQARLRHAVEMKKEAQRKLQGFGDVGQIEKLKIDAHILMLTEELDLVFDAIRLAQEKAEDRASQKSAVLLHASSSEISYRMLDNHDQLLVKLAVRKIHFHWMNRQDSSTVNHLSVGDLQAFDGAADAEWTEILSKCEEKSNHPSVKVSPNPLSSRCINSPSLHYVGPRAARPFPACGLDSLAACWRYHHL